MEDIILSIPEPCGEPSCECQWHMSHYWIQEDGTYTVCDDCGDHETIEESDIPTYEQEDELWLGYFQHVAETGKDPVGEFRLPTAITKPRKWQANVQNWIGASKYGLKVIGVRRRGRGPWIPIEDAPQVVKDFLLLNEHGCISDFHTFDQLKTEATESSVKRGDDIMTMRVNFTVDEPPAPWSDERIAAWLKKKARAEIQKIKKRRSKLNQQ